MDIKVRSLLLGSAAAGLVYWIANLFLGFSAASVFPEVLKDVATGAPPLLLMLFVGDLFLENIVSIGSLSAVTIYLLVRFASLAWLQAAIGFIATETVIAYSFIWRSLALQDFLLIHYILLLPHLVALSCCVLVAAYWGNKSLKRH